jgi:ribonuclease D
MSLVETIELEGREVKVVYGDLDERAFALARGARLVGWDIETTGLDWRAERIATVQLRIEPGATLLVRLNGEVPQRLKAVLEDGRIRKVFHHAMFDLRFLVHHWDAKFENVVCTKISSKLLRNGVPASDHSLAALVGRYFGVDLDKTQRLSDWDAPDLNDEQLAYAANDVLFLHPLYLKLDREIRRQGLAGLRDRCFEHLRTRVELELCGYPDVFAY